MGGPAENAKTTRFERDLFQAIEMMYAKRDMRRLIGIMVGNQDAEFPSDEITDSYSWKGDNTAQNAVYLGIQQQYLYWKHTWVQEEEEEHMAQGLSTFDFHLYTLLASA